MQFVCWCHYFQFSAWLVGLYFGGKIQKDQRMTVRSCLKPTLVGLTQFLNYYAVNDDIYDVDDIKKKNYENGYYEYIIKT